MLQGEHSAILSTFIKLPFGIKILVVSNFEWPFYTGFTVFANQDLQKKREEKREENKQKAEEEIAYLQASGKITKKPFKTGLGKKKIGTKPDMRKNRSDNNINEDTNINTTEDSSPEGEKKVTNDDVLEDYYQVLLNQFRPIKFFIKLHTTKAGWSIVYISLNIFYFRKIIVQI